ncbi:MAG: GNAT family N-acetyltransferase [Methanothrix sp.]|nr:GNAT family N-acetyltransferase [Methanothrix sp.]
MRYYVEEAGRTIESGRIWRSGRGSLSYRMCFLGEEELPEILQLQEEVALALPDPEIFILHGRDDLQGALGLSVIGIRSEGRLAAYSMVRIPSEDDLGAEIGIPQRSSVIHLQATAVHPSYRGFGLQRRMILAHLKVIREMGYRHICCTVSPKNPVSLANFLSCGFLIRGLAQRTRGWWRYILHREALPSQVIWGDERIDINASDIHGQVSLLKEGFLGCGVAIGGEGAVVSYRRPRIP